MDVAGYSVFAHAVDRVFMQDRNLMVIVDADPLSLYCDASGNEHEPLTVVGGVLASVEQWREFTPRWKEVLAKYEVGYFRASEFASHTGAFAKGWKGDQDRKNAFSWDLLCIIGPTVKWWGAIAVLQRNTKRLTKFTKSTRTISRSQLRPNA